MYSHWNCYSLKNRSATCDRQSASVLLDSIMLKTIPYLSLYQHMNLEQRSTFDNEFATHYFVLFCFVVSHSSFHTLFFRLSKFYFCFVWLFFRNSMYCDVWFKIRVCDFIWLNTCTNYHIQRHWFMLVGR